ncbi:hypothetical protein [Sphingosinicella sp.]|uniref:hypothetical protein n=1 Tax=Sphingosinicella sp. TaxID=1917971 RepID=UPI00403809C4
MKHLILLATAALAATPAAAQPRPWHLTPDGYGPTRLGMTRAQVERALNIRLEGEPVDDANACIEMGATRGEHRDLIFMFIDRRLSRVAAIDASRVTTPRGLGIGATAAQVRRTYGRGLRAEEHTYIGRPAEYLTFWTRPNRRGVRFVTGLNRRVEAVIAGNDSIQLIEGCA